MLGILIALISFSQAHRSVKGWYGLTI